MFIFHSFGVDRCMATYIDAGLVGQEVCRPEIELCIVALDILFGFVSLNIVSNFIPVTKTMPKNKKK